MGDSGPAASCAGAKASANTADNVTSVRNVRGKACANTGNRSTTASNVVGKESVSTGGSEVDARSVVVEACANMVNSAADVKIAKDPPKFLLLCPVWRVVRLRRVWRSWSPLRSQGQHHRFQ